MLLFQFLIQKTITYMYYVYVYQRLTTYYSGESAVLSTLYTHPLANSKEGHLDSEASQWLGTIVVDAEGVIHTRFPVNSTRDFYKYSGYIETIHLLQ